MSGHVHLIEDQCMICFLFVDFHNFCEMCGCCDDCCECMWEDYIEYMVEQEQP